jgi:hypothetical protein
MNGPGRGTNFRDDILKVKEEMPEREREQALMERLENVVRTTGPKKELQIFDGVGSSPPRPTENASGEESPTQVRSTLPTDVIPDQESFIEVDPSIGKTDAATNIANNIIEQRNVRIEPSGEPPIGGSIKSSAVEDIALDDVTDLVEVELDPLGGGVEMTSLSINNHRNR